MWALSHELQFLASPNLLKSLVDVLGWQPELGKEGVELASPFIQHHVIFSRKFTNSITKNAMEFLDQLVSG